MSTSEYMAGRKKWTRPQAMLWADNSGLLINGGYIPQGVEPDNFLILSDHNRAELTFGVNRIENRSRMINATSRAYFVADKMTLSTSWSNFPSRVASTVTGFSDSNGSLLTGAGASVYVVDNGASGELMKEWHKTHPGSFWVYFAYDVGPEEGETSPSTKNLTRYVERKQMFFTSFEYVVVKRGGNTYDLVNINLALEEV